MSTIVVDSGIGNVRSVANMVLRLSPNVRICSDPTELKHARRIILPGVGAFDSMMERLTATGFAESLESMVQRQKVPILGICVGMQVFANSSEEGARAGLGWIPGTVKKFHFEGASASLKIPHMGWNHVRDIADEPLLNGIRDNPRFYFVHSYYFDCEDKASFAAGTDYGGQFASIVRKDNVVGVQFHAEKSHRFGLRLLDNFLQC